jgi:hypothetical protein
VHRRPLAAGAGRQPSRGAGTPGANHADWAHDPARRDGRNGVGERAAAPVIHSGDALVLEESTPLVEARLEARALGPAICGGEFNARLAVGGKVVRAVALGKGRAAFVSQTGTRP